jgi:hypothetical protein
MLVSWNLLFVASAFDASIDALSGVGKRDLVLSAAEGNFSDDLDLPATLRKPPAIKFPFT